MVYLNNNSLIKFQKFKKYAEIEIIKININIISNEYFYKSIFYPCKKNCLSF